MAADKRNSTSRTHGSLLPWVLLLVVVIGGGLYLGRDRLLDLIEDRAITPEQTASVISGPGVLKRIHQLNNLETVAFKIETVVTNEKAGTWWKLFQDKQQVIVIANGTVTAGIDLSEIRAGDVDVSHDGRKITIHMPPAEILHTDLEELRTYDYKTGIFGLVTLDPKLLEEAHADSRKKMREIACASDVLKMATESGERQIENLFSMTEAAVEVIPSDVPACLSEDT